MEADPLAQGSTLRQEEGYEWGLSYSQNQPGGLGGRREGIG